MGSLVELGIFLACLGVFFGGIGFLWWCSLYQSKINKDRN
jgi:hypothetical protein